MLRCQVAEKLEKDLDVFFADLDTNDLAKLSTSEPPFFDSLAWKYRLGDSL